MGIAVATLVVGEDYRKAVALATQSKIDYCHNQGYDFIFETGFDATRPVPWSKIPLIKRVLPRYDFVFWSDADAMVVNPDVRLEQMFGDFLDSDKHMVVTRDAAGNINLGNFIIRNCDWSFELLSKIWEQTQFLHHKWWENAAFIYLFSSEPKIQKHTAVVPYDRYAFNSYPHYPNGYKEGDFIVHFAGIHNLGELERLISKHHRSLSQKPEIAASRA